MVGEDRVADPAILPRHGPGLDPALEAIAHHEVAACPQLLDERHEVGEIIAVIGIAHDDIDAACRQAALIKCRAVAAASAHRRTRAPHDRAISCEPSVEPLSATTTSPAIACLARKALALRMQTASVSASFKHGMRIVNSRGSPLR